MATEQFFGPVDYVVFAFDEGADLGLGLQALLDRVQQGIVEILDIELVSRDKQGQPVKRSLSDLQSATDLDLAVFDGAGSGVLDDADLSRIVLDLEPDQFGLAIVYEDRSLAAAAGAWIAAGGVELFSGGVDIADLEQALEEGNPS